MSLPALENFFTLHTPRFSHLEVFNRGFKDRDLVVVHKRKIDHLVIVAGPDSADSLATPLQPAIHNPAQHHPFPVDRAATPFFPRWQPRQTGPALGFARVDQWTVDPGTRQTTAAGYR